MKKYLLIVVLLLPSYSTGLTIHPDSIVLTIKPMLAMHSPIDTVTLKNETNAAIAIDSIKIRFCNGDSGDFKKGYNIQPGDFNRYNYEGWVYGGATHVCLQYLRDSLFMAQDSVGLPMKIFLHPNDSAFFYLQVITNCPVCGRMPSFPNTSKYRYSFHLSNNTSINLMVRLNDTVFTSTKVVGNTPRSNYTGARDKPTVQCRVRSHEIQFQVFSGGLARIDCYSLSGACLATMLREPHGKGAVSIDLRDYSIGPGAYIITLSLPGLNDKKMIFPVFIYH
jgi:hypothetical protein